MVQQVNKSQRIVILFEAYLAFKEEATISEFYKWLIEKKISGYNYYLSRQIGMIVKTCGKFDKKGKKWIRKW